MAGKTQSVPSVQEAVRLMNRAPAVGQGRRSPVVIWLMKNRAELEESFRLNAPDWNVLADYLADHGITDGMGKRPTGRIAREAWGRVKKLPAPVQPVEQATPTKAKPAPEPATPKPSVAPDVREATPVVTPVPPRTFRFATPKVK